MHQIEMKSQLIVLLLFIFGLFVATTIATENAGSQHEPETTGLEPSSARANFVMQKLFDFEGFREKFDKHYANGAEIARRTKLFMARAFAVFISGIKYMYHKGTKFLKINSRSDWTRKERQASMNRRTGRQTATVVGETSDRETPVPAVDPEDVKQVMAEINERKHEDSDHATELEEVKNNDGQHQQHQRKRRSADSLEKTSDRPFLQPKPTRHLSMEELSGDSLEPEMVSPKYKSSVPSNNPDYEQLETFSEGADDDDDENQIEPISQDEARRIDQQASQGNYLGFIMNSIRGAAGHFLSAPQHDDSAQQLKVMSQKKGFKMPKTKHLSESDDPAQEEIVEKKKKKKPKDQMFLDYRSDKCFLPPKKQGKCGSCYIFATTALVEYHHCMQTGDLVPFSEQYVIDCGHNRTNSEFINGCDGGFERSVGEFYSNFGMELSADYPYKAKDQVCPYPKDIEAKHMGHTKIDEPEILSFGEDDEDEFPSAVAIEKLLTEKGPLFTLIYPSDDFDDFGGGVDVLNCDLESEFGHSMAIVGHGIEDGIEYWLIRNSYGVDFGVKGHYKLAKSSKDGCIARVGYVRGLFKRNRSRRNSRKYLLDELRNKNLLKQFKPTR